MPRLHGDTKAMARDKKIECSVATIERAFWDTFHESGEIVFPFYGDVEFREKLTKQWFNEFWFNLEKCMYFAGEKENDPESTD